MGLYLAAAALSLLHADPMPAAGPAKLLGHASLVAWAALTSDLATRVSVTPSARVVAVASLLVSAAAVTGVALALAGVPTSLTGTYGDLRPGAYARAQAGFTHPNLLASFCVFASALVARDDAALPRTLRRTALVALWIAVVLTFSRGLLALVLAALVRRKNARSASVLFAVAAVALIVSLTVWHVSIDPLRPWEARLDPGPSPRWEGLLTSIETVREHPLLGAGPGSAAGRVKGAPFDAHCTPVNVAATLGLPALAAFVAIPVALWRRRPRPTDLATWGGLAGVGLDALATDVEDFRHVWVLLGLADARPQPDVVRSSGRGPQGLSHR
jgi:hypothetical protein